MYICVKGQRCRIGRCLSTAFLVMEVRIGIVICYHKAYIVLYSTHDRMRIRDKSILKTGLI